MNKAKVLFYSQLSPVLQYTRTAVLKNIWKMKARGHGSFAVLLIISKQKMQNVSEADGG